jgi:hypothetical protein
MARFFLSYRRDDSAGFAGRLADAIEARFGAGSVFRDVDDIAPGEDFVHALDRQLRTVDAVLVVIGPRWLDSVGAARLNDSDDFVRREIETALASGKLVLPLLVGGAQMPAQAALPESLFPLARKQAVSLSDAGWKDDVARLGRTLGQLVPAALPQAASERRFGLVLAGVAFVTLLAIASGLYLTQRGPSASSVTASNLAAVSGRWQATIRYEWGDTHQESFEFQTLNKELTGTASYLGQSVPIEQVELDGAHLRFTIRSQETMGSDAPWKEVTHRYTGEIAADGIWFTLLSTGGYTLHRPLKFVAQRVRP